MLRQVREALELPGALRDYHFVLVRHLDTFWNNRDADPALLLELEALCWLDLQLAEAHPSAIRNEHYGRKRAVDDQDEAEMPQEREFYYIASVRQLLQLYEREGYLQEALNVARRAVPFGNISTEYVTNLEERLRAIAAEKPLGEGDVLK